MLVVDDDSLVLTSTCLLLEDLGHQVTSALSGAQALAMFDSEQVIDLVITDMAMPQMNGAQLAQAIRIIKPSLLIILAPGFLVRRVQDVLFETGMDGDLNFQLGPFRLCD